ncbi:hypothetical protein ACEUZ9_002954 [Paracoccus litorisediminis]|uniref:hypothetical protein n=1 Tax=Paracoccus litorisediminis TaxID=2006130 RepID=UPI0037323B6A
MSEKVITSNNHAQSSPIDDFSSTEIIDKILQDQSSRSLLKLFVRGDNDSEKLAKLIELQKNSNTIVQSAILEMVEISESLDISKTFPGMRSKALQAPTMKAIDRVWQAVSSGREIKLKEENITKDDAKLYCILKKPSIRVIKFDTKDPDDIDYLDSIGINQENLKKNLNNFLSVESHWSNTLDNVDYASLTAKTTVRSVESYCGYQDRCIQEGSLHLPDPFTGNSLDAIDSCLLLGRSCFFFKGTHPLHLICAGSGAKALCIFISKMNLIIDLNAGLSKFLSTHLFSNLFSLLTMRFIRHADEYNRAIGVDATTIEGRKIVVTLQQAANPAHHVWNFFPGLERIANSKGAKNISEIIFGGTEFYGPLANIFPEFENIINHGEKSSVIDPHPFDPERIVLTVGGYFINHGLKERLMRAAELSDKTLLKIQDVNEISSGHFPIVWFGLRKGDKSWLDQVSGFSEIANAILDKHPNALFIVDGFLVPMGIDQVSEKWGGFKNDMNAMAEEIRGNIKSPSQVINLIGATLGDGLFWAEKTDIYVSPVGSTQHRIGWFSDAYGLVFSAPRGSGPLKRDRLPGAWEAEGSKIPEYIIGTPAEQGIRRGAGDRRSHLENVRLDVSSMIEKIFQFIASREANCRKESK